MFDPVSTVPQVRVRTVRDAPPDAEADYVLYWMTAYRRTAWNFSLQRAIEWAVRLQKPLLVFEPLRCGYRWASDRFQRFVAQGMVDNAQRLQRRGVAYYPYVEPSPGAGKGCWRSLLGEPVWWSATISRVSSCRG